LRVHLRLTVGTLACRSVVGRQAPRAGRPPGATPREDRSSEPGEMDLCDVGEETR